MGSKDGRRTECEMEVASMFDVKIFSSFSFPRSQRMIWEFTPPGNFHPDGGRLTNSLFYRLIDAFAVVCGFPCEVSLRVLSFVPFEQCCRLGASEVRK